MSTKITELNPVQSDWVRRLKANDEQALKSLYVNNYPRVASFVLRNSGSTEDAKDLFQEAFIATWQNIMLDKFTISETATVSGYLFQIARNKWIDRLRQRKKEMTMVSAPEADSPPELIPEETADHLALVQEQYGLLGEPCRELLDRFYFRRESLRTIAGIFSWTEATAKNNKYRCLQKLRAAVLKEKKK